MRRIYTLLLFSILTIYSCTSDVTNKEVENKVVAELESDVAVEWAEMYLGVETHLAGFRPAATARAMAYIAMTAYETAVPGMPDNRSLTEVLNVPNLPKLEPGINIDYNLALNVAYKEITLEMMHSINLSQSTEILKLYDRLKSQYSANLESSVVAASENWGVRVSRAFSAYAQSDAEGHKQVRDIRPSSYVPPVFEGAWEPTPPSRGAAMYPYWGKARLLASTESEIQILPPPAYSTTPGSKYYDDFKEVYDMVKQNDFRSQWQAEFWSDDIVGLTFSPPARNLAIAIQLIEIENLNLGETIEFLFTLGIASNDAAVAAWKGKYEANVERPITFIRKHIDPNFSPTLGRAIGNPGISPDFPGYPSGHSTFGGISEAVFAHYFGANKTFTDNCHKNRNEFYGLPRTFHSFKELAEENAFSRIPLGVHPRFDCEEGLRLGRLVGANAVNLRLKK